MSRVRYLALRSLQTIFLIWVVITALFFFFRLMPGDFTDLMIFEGASPETVERFEENWGLNDPIYVQYFRYLQNMVFFDAGTSVRYRIPVTDLVGRRIFNSFILIAPAITLAYIIGGVIGVYAGIRRGKFFEKYGLVGVIMFGATPSFVIAVLAVVIFAGMLDLFPTGGMIPLELQGTEPWWGVYLTRGFVWHYTLPFTVIVLRYLLLPTLIMRNSVVEVLGQGFIEYQKVTGIPAYHRWLTVAKHSSLPVITLYPISMTQAIGGLVLVELVFNWPGIGFTLVQAVFDRDTPVVQFIFILIAIFVILANFIIDIIYGLIDPRVRVGEDPETSID